MSSLGSKILVAEEEEEGEDEREEEKEAVLDLGRDLDREDERDRDLMTPPAAVAVAVDAVPPPAVFGVSGGAELIRGVERRDEEEVDNSIGSAWRCKGAALTSS